MVSDASDSPCWAVAWTHRNGERTAIENLSRQGYRNYCPMILKRIRHARQTKLVKRPLFPGYVFVSSGESTQSWRPVFSTRGIRQLIAQDGCPSLLSDAFIDGLKAREIDGVIEPAQSDFVEGQDVRIVDGSLEGLSATIIALDDKQRVVVLLDLLNGKVKANLPMQTITAI